ncbi:MAG: YihY/virulence factor BrkB family protein [Lentisphaerae bacterium]|nr:YihY/virulence factor BrkB family protein [Lentisphaerota bacterium]
MKFKISILLWLRNCWRIIKYSAKRYTGDQLGQQAVVLTYYTLFAIVPMVALLFGISKGFGLEAMLREAVYSRFPAQHGMLDYVCEIAEKTLSEASGGVVAGVGVVVLLWTVIWLNANVERSFNVVWGLASRRNMLRKFSSYISLILLAPVLMVIVNTLVTLLTSLKDTNGIAGSFSWLKPVVEYSITLLPIAVTCLFFFFLYLKVPNTKVRWQGACVAGIITGVAFQVLQDSFVFLQSSVFAYNRLYGGFAILPLFLIWVNWSWQLILFGAEISFVHQHLRSGVFNEIRGNVDLRLRREHQLAILHRVFLEFEKGNGPVFEDELALLLRVPDVVFRSEVNELLDKGMLCRSVSTEDRRVALLPGVPPDRFTIMDFMIEIHGQGDKEVQEFARFEELFVKIENAVKESGLNMKVHEV